jgi:hypothetical protein
MSLEAIQEAIAHLPAAENCGIGSCSVELPKKVQNLAFQARDSYHPWLGLKGQGEVWTGEIEPSYRAIAHRSKNHLTWFCISSHEDYNKVLKRAR